MRKKGIQKEKNANIYQTISAKSSKVIASFSSDAKLIEWAKEYAARRERSFSWLVTHLLKERRNKEWLEKNIAHKTIR